ncbi:hypothetical protein B0H13DRAFT_2574100 [Mycena leptocephala]|nr:hypothetical protein B0H13DRAFT_2574100 [Mycena leptocephala]
MCQTSLSYSLPNWSRVQSLSAASIESVAVVQDTPQRMGPLLVKALINFPKARAAAKAASVEPANIRPGVGMVFGLLFVIVLTGGMPHRLSAHKPQTLMSGG